MNFIDNRTKSISAMALDGLYERSKAISSNTANALTPGYQRKEVSFENNLKNIIQRENEKEETKIQNSIQYQKNPESILKGQSPAQLAFLSTQCDDGYTISVDVDSADPLDGDNNNVNLETEMMDEAKNGMQYSVLASLLSKQYAQLNTIIKGQIS